MPDSLGSRDRAQRRDDHGAVAVLVALVTCAVLFLVAALTVDLGNTWARRGSLQTQADLAAKLAAEQLPVDSTVVPASPSTTQLSAARAVAHYLACHPVAGQAALHTLPSCPAGASWSGDAGLTTYARALLANGVSHASATLGEVSFPTTNQVRVVVPSARVEYGFGRVAGAEHSVQTRAATAVVLSPGQVLPIGMSLTCLAAQLGSSPVAGSPLSSVMPLNYVSAGPPATAVSTAGLLPPTWGDLAPTNAGIVLGLHSSTPTPVTPDPGTGLSTVRFDWSVGTVASVFGSGYAVSSTTLHLRRFATPAAGAAGQVTSSVLLPTSPQTAVVDLPAGTWQAKIAVTATRVLPTPGTLTRYAALPVEFSVLPRSSLLSSAADARNFVSCARPVQSPRLGFQSGAEDGTSMAVNIAQGLDHAVAAYPGVATVLAGTSISAASPVSSLSATLANPSLLVSCGTASGVRPDYPTRRLDGPNCFRVDTGRDWSSALTQGLLTGGSPSQGSFSGRLRCASSSGCNHLASRPVLTDPGGIPGTYNNDHFADFIRTPGLLQDPFLYSLDTFLSPTLPVVTPPSTSVDPQLYASPRFFWAPVSVNAYTTTGSGAAADYPVLTFRPVFLTPAVDSAITTPIDTLTDDLVTQAMTRGFALTQVLNRISAASGLTSCLLSAGTCRLVQVARQTEAELNAVLSSLTTSTVTTGGLVIDTAAKQVRAARFMTVSPGALPAPPRDYRGPVTAYLGVGPKIVRLVD